MVETSSPSAPSSRSGSSFLGQALKSIFRGLDLARRVVLNLVFFGFLVFLWAVSATDPGPVVPEKGALVLAPRGVIVEQLSGDPLDRAIQNLTDTEIQETLLKDLVDALAEAKDDERIAALVIDVDQMLGAGFVPLSRLRQAIGEFKTSGKPVFATADFLSGDRYHLAAAADEIYLHPLGAVMLEGYGVYRTYYKKGLEDYEIDWNLVRVGEFKSAAEPYERMTMSEEVKAVNREWLGELWNAFLDDVATSRELEPATVVASIEEFNTRLAEVGDSADMALGMGIVDHVAHPDVLRQRLIELVGEDDAGTSFAGIDAVDYIQAVRGLEGLDASDAEVAVIVARGTILPGDQPSGTIGGTSTSALLRQARQDEAVQAIVLRVDSGGGSAFASEKIRREVELARQAEKVVVVSMGNVAASGGYWIAASADEIWASPETITGSIGIFGYFPTFQKPLRKYLGMNVDGVGTTWLAGVRPDRELPEEMRTALELMVNQGYRDFLQVVAEGRGMTVEEVDAVAQGRVWTGRQAKERGLVDELGGLDGAIAAAARLAELGEDPSVRYIEKELSFSDQLMVDLFSTAAGFGVRLPGMERSPYLGRIEELASRADPLARIEDPRGLLAHCLCEVD